MKTTIALVVMIAIPLIAFVVVFGVVVAIADVWREMR